MKKIIYHIRKQPEVVKMRILHLSTFIAGFILIVLWFYSLSTNLTSPDTQSKMSQDLKPLSALKGNIVDGYNSIIEPNLGVKETQ